MTQTRIRFSSFEEYLATSEGLPEGRYEYWDGALIALMPESGENDEIISLLYHQPTVSAAGSSRTLLQAAQARSM